MMRTTTITLALCALAAGAAAQDDRDSPGGPPRLPQPLGTMTVSTKDVPSMLHPADTLKAFIQVHAKGTQIYECAQDKAGNWAWQFRRPEATLFDATGARVGEHGAGPVWRLLDGSSVVGQVQASWIAPDMKSIPWLLLTVKSHSDAGQLAAAEAIQRVNTQGGVAPVEPCSAALAGTTQAVPYSADYRFWRNGSDSPKN